MKCKEKKSERDYQKFAEFVAERDRLLAMRRQGYWFEEDDVQIIEEESTPPMSITAEQRYREYKRKDLLELQKLSIAYQQKQQKLIEAAYRAIPEEEKTFQVSPLTPQQEALVAKYLNGPLNQVMVNKFNITIIREDLQRLRPGQWLNDEVINFYIELLSEKANSNPRTRCLFFNTHFFSLLTRTGFAYNRIAKWTKSVDIFTLTRL